MFGFESAGPGVPLGEPPGLRFTTLSLNDVSNIFIKSTKSIGIIEFDKNFEI